MMSLIEHGRVEKSTSRCIFIAMHKTEAHQDSLVHVEDSFKIIGIGNNNL